MSEEGPFQRMLREEMRIAEREYTEVLKAAARSWLGDPEAPMTEKTGLVPILKFMAPASDLFGVPYWTNPSVPKGTGYFIDGCLVLGGGAPPVPDRRPGWRRIGAPFRWIASRTGALRLIRFLRH